MSIPFTPQKVLSLDKALSLKTPKIKGDYILTEKFEGWYVTIYYDGTKFHNPLSSAGRVIPAFSWVADKLNNKGFNSAKPIVYCRPFMLIAEAYLENTPFEILNGIFNRSKGTCGCSEVIFKVHDWVPLDFAMSALERYVQIPALLDQLDSKHFQITPVLHVGPYSQSIWQHYFEHIANAGGEGIVAKQANSFYQQGKRNADLLKLKLECTIDALAIQLDRSIGAKGNPSYTLVSQRANGVLIRTVLSKHSDQMLFDGDANNVLGKVVQIKAMQEYPNGQLRQPVFQYVREDKLPTEID